MRKSFAFTILGASLFALPLLSPATARANIADCGNIDVSASGTCEVQVDAACTANCTPLKVQAACAAQLQGTCSASCDRVPSIDCTGSCQGDCEANCNVTPAQFDCTASCRADASANCDAECASNANKSQCTASCQATVTADCDANCKVVPGTANCAAKCQGSCQGSCTVQKELDCQVKCQGAAYAQCEVDVQGGCEVDCRDPSGALFCDGEYIDHNGALKDCIAAIRAELPTVYVDASAQGSSGCSDNNTCSAEGSANVSTHCALSSRGVGADHELTGAFAVLAALGAACVRRRKAR